MNKFFISSAGLVVLTLAFLIASNAQDKPSQPHKDVSPTPINLTVNMAEQDKYPAKIGRFKFMAETTLTEGKTVKYLAEDTKIDVFYYNGGGGGNNPGTVKELKAELGLVKDALREVEKLGMYKDVVFEEDKEIEISGTKFIASKCTYTQLEGMVGKLTSFTFLAAKGNDFFKVRATTNGKDGTEFEKELIPFIEEALKINFGNGVDLSESPENDKKILKMAKELYDNPLSKKTADDLATMVRYADKSQRITVTVKASMLDIDDDYGQLFVGFYVAGAMRYYLEHPDDLAAKDKADPEIRRYLVKLYQTIRKKDDSYKNKIYEEMEKQLKGK